MILVPSGEKFNLARCLPRIEIILINVKPTELWILSLYAQFIQNMTHSGGLCVNGQRITQNYFNENDNIKIVREKNN